MKIIINSCYGGFSIDQEVVKNFNLSSPYDSSWVVRENKDLIAMLESGHNISGLAADLEVVEIPDEYGYQISEYDGYETVVLKPLKSRIVLLAHQPEKLIEYLEGCDAF
jgi:hypothetical protein